MPEPVADLDEPTDKAVYAGTHRVCEPAETLARITPLFPRFGITRLADVTWLDDIGVPVYQAIRPNSYLLSVSQGKGLTPLLAMVSAAMEAIELWHAEQLGPAALTATVGEIESALEYRVDELRPLPRHHLTHATRLEWTPGRHLLSGADALVPTEYLRLDCRVSRRWALPLFQPGSNGLASGNTVAEASLHGLYEVIERDALTRTGKPTKTLIDLDSVSGSAAGLISQFAAAGVALQVDFLPSPIGLPVFRARIVSDSFPFVFEGLGCHLDRDVALCRALTEAAQSRATAIAGVRDDLPSDWYRRAAAAMNGRLAAPALNRWSGGATTMSISDVPSIMNRTLSEDLDLVGRRIAEYTGRDPVIVDHTRPDLEVPVVRVICLGLLFDPKLV